MKKHIIISFIFLSTFTGICQQNRNVLNDNLKDIVFTQVQNNLEVSFPLFIAAPGFFALTNVEYLNEKLLYTDIAPGFDELTGNSNLNQKALFQNLEIEFLPLFKSDTTIQLQAKSKNNIIYNLVLSRYKDKETFTISSPDNDYKKEINYSKGQLESMSVKRQDNITLLLMEKENENLLRQIIFHTNSGMYNVTEDIYKNNVIIKRIYYKQSADKNSRKVKRITNYKYDSSGKLFSQIDSDRMGKIIDSVNYVYDGAKLVSVLTYKDAVHKQVLFRYKGDRISNYMFKNNDNTIDIDYEYSNNGQITCTRISDKSKPIIETYNFDYNSASVLVSIKKYKTRKDSGVILFEDQYIFSYYDSRILKSIIVANETGNILKEINYDLNYLNK